MSEFPAKTLDAAALLAIATTMGAATAVPASAQVIVPTVKTAKAIAPVTREITFKGTEAQGRAKAAGLAASDPVQSKLLTAALDSARGRPGFNPAAVSIGVGFTMRFRGAAQQGGMIR